MVVSAYAPDRLQWLTHQRIAVHEFVAVWLPFGYVARHAEQFGSQMSGLLLPKASLEAGLRSCPVNGRFVKLRQPCSRKYNPKSPMALPFGRSHHKATLEQRFECAHERRSIHHHRLGEPGHRQARIAAQRPENAELRGRDPASDK